MNIFISLSSHNNIDKKYIDDIDYISKIISKDYNLVTGIVMDDGMANTVINNFKNNNKKIFLKTLELYNEDKEKFNYVDFKYFNTTFDRTKEIYINSDMFLIVPGGTGTLSELFSFIEEKRTKKDNKDIIIYNKDNYYTNIIEIINNYVKNNFNDEDIFNYLKFFNDKDDLLKYIESKKEN